MRLIIILILAGILITNILAFKTNQKQLELNKICAVYTVNREPTKALVNGYVYDLTNKSGFEHLFVNQFDKEQLQNLYECIQIKSR